MASAVVQRFERDGDAICVVATVAGEPGEYRACAQATDLDGKTVNQVKAFLTPKLTADRDAKTSKIMTALAAFVGATVTI